MWITVEIYSKELLGVSHLFNLFYVSFNHNSMNTSSYMNSVTIPHAIFFFFYQQHPTTFLIATANDCQTNVCNLCTLHAYRHQFLYDAQTYPTSSLLLISRENETISRSNVSNNIKLHFGQFN